MSRDEFKARCRDEYERLLGDRVFAEACAEATTQECYGGDRSPEECARDDIESWNPGD